MSASGSAWQPYWLPGHAYTVGAVVLPSTFAGYLWTCTTPGTSGATEPAWPDPITSAQYTVADGAVVVWTLATGFRMALQAGIMSVLTAFAAANPTIVRKVLSVRPRSLAGELPVLFLGTIAETVTITSGTRRRELTAEVHYVDSVPDPDQYNSRSNFVWDALIDPLTAAYHAASPRAVSEPTAQVEPRDFDEGGTQYPEVMFTIRGYILEGRT